MDKALAGGPGTNMWAVSPFTGTIIHKKPPISLVVAASSQPSGNEKQRKGEGRNQLSGLDVLWAMQKAATAKKGAKKNRKREELTSAGGRKEEDGVVDYSNVRPLCIKSEWGPRLNHLEKRLQYLSSNSNNSR